MGNFLETLMREIYEADDFIVVGNIQVPKPGGSFYEFDGVAIKGQEVIWLEASASADSLQQVRGKIEDKLGNKEVLVGRLRQLLQREDIEIKEVHYYFEGLSLRPRQETQKMIEEFGRMRPPVFIFGMQKLLEKAEDILGRFPPDRTPPQKMGYLKLIQAYRNYRR